MRLTDYYNQADNELAYQEIVRRLEREAAIVRARVVKSSVKKIKETYNTTGETTVLNTKTAIEQITGQMVHAIKGQVRKELKKTIDKTLPKFEAIFE